MTEEQQVNVTCPGCRSTDVVSFCEIAGLPVDVGKTERSAEAARRANRGDVQLCYCSNCGLVHNAKFDPSKIGFEPGYEVALHHSDTFRVFIETLAQRLLDKYSLNGRSILDIGCGGGYFLETFCRLGGVKGVGVDPTVPKVGRVDVDQGELQLVRDFWSRKYEHLIGDMIVCQSMFEDVPKPLEFVTELRAMIGDRHVPVYFEVFNGHLPFERGETWSIHYEQCNLFSLDCMVRLFTMAGFDVTDAGHCYQADQYIYIEAIPGDATRERESPCPMPPTVSNFAAVHKQNVDLWSSRLQDLKSQGRNVVIWGAGGKCVNFLNTLDAADLIQHVIEINPDRQGTFIAGSGQQIVPPSFIQSNPPDLILVMNPVYVDEIREQAKQLGVCCEVCVA